MNPAVRTAFIGYALAAALMAGGWGGPIGNLGLALAGALTLINAAGLAESMVSKAESIKPIITFVGGTILAFALLVGSALIFIATGGFGL